MKKILILMMAMMLLALSAAALAEPTVVATVDGTEYTDIRDAIVAAAYSGNAVNVKSDITLTTWKQISLYNTGDITINGNGHTIIFDLQNQSDYDDGGEPSVNFIINAAKELNMNNWRIELPDFMSGFSMYSGVIDNVSLIGGFYGVYPISTADGSSVTIQNSLFADTTVAIYNEYQALDVQIKNNAFKDSSVSLYANEAFTGNLFSGAAEFNIVNGYGRNESPMKVEGNTFDSDTLVALWNGSNVQLKDNEIHGAVSVDGTMDNNSIFDHNCWGEDRTGEEALGFPTTNDRDECESNPATGDNSQPMLYAALLMMSLVGMIALKKRAYA